MPQFLVVPQQARRAAGGRQQHVEIAVAVDVGESGAAADQRLRKIAAGLLDRNGEEFGRRRRTAVPVQLRRLGVLLAFLDFVNVVVEVAVGDQQVDPSVEIDVGEEHAKFQPEARGGPQSGGDGVIGEQQHRALRTVKGRHFVGEVPDRHAERVVVAKEAAVDSHRPARVAVAVERNSGLRADLFEGAVAAITQQKVLHRVVRNDEIHPAVLIEIDRRQPQRLRGWNVRHGVPYLHAGRGRDIGEFSAAVVAIEVRKRPFERIGAAVGPQRSVERAVKRAIDVGRPADVIADEQVEVGVVVVIQPAAARAPFVFRPGHAGRIGHIFEFAAIVSEQRVRTDAGNEQIDPSVVIEIADCRPLAVKRHIQTAGCGDVGKLAGPVIFVQRHGRRLAVGGLLSRPER
jgi:hypothetical protein